jgi:hypothetical protein
MNDQEATQGEVIPELAVWFREQKPKERELVRAVFRAALEREHEPRDQQPLVQPQEQPNGVKPGAAVTPPTNEPQTIHYTELPPAQPHSPLTQAWNFYRREVGRLLADSHEGRFVLIKGEELIGIWDTEQEAEAVAHQRCWRQPCLIHQVRTCEPLLRLSARLQRWLR